LTRKTSNQPPEGGKEDEMETKSSKLTDEQIRQMILAGKIELTDVIDAVINLNGIVGVGLIRLADDVSDYIRQH